MKSPSRIGFLCEFPDVCHVLGTDVGPDAHHHGGQDNDSVSGTCPHNVAIIFEATKRPEQSVARTAVEVVANNLGIYILMNSKAEVLQPCELWIECPLHGLGDADDGRAKVVW